MTNDNPYSPPAAPLTDAASEQEPAGYFTVGPLKLSLMSLATFGLYQLYWFYKNWVAARAEFGDSLSPFWRAVFAPLWCYSLGTHLSEHAERLRIEIGLSAAGLAVAYFVLSALWRLPEPYWLVSMLSFVPLLPFDAAARKINGKGELAAPTFGKFSGLNIAGIVAGFILLALSLYGSTLPDPA